MPDNGVNTHNLPSDQYAALVSLRDCGALGARKQITRYFALVLRELVTAKARIIINTRNFDGPPTETWVIYRLTDAGRAAL